MGCGTSVMKWILGIINFIFWLAGAALLAIGLYLLLAPNTERYLEIFELSVEDSNLLKPAIYLFIALGAFVFLVGFFGCCGACCENKVLLILYCICLVLLIIIEIAAIVLAFVFWFELLDEDVLEKGLLDGLSEVKPANGTGEGITLAFNFIQFTFTCCGITGFSDYKNNTNFNTNQPVPITCCTAVDPNTNFDMFAPLDQSKCFMEVNDDVVMSPYVNRQGCKDGLLEWIKAEAFILGGIALAILLVELILLILSCCLVSRFRHSGGTKM